ncbi:MAG TPA: glycosyltransferase family 1 protein [Ignavibacteriaceae bacterium]|nr:glycosyltransferase family 1 protein [Ignavibacteriaceae bacterium]
MRIGIEVSTLTNKTTGTNRYLSCLLEQIGQTDNEIISLSPGDDKLFGFPAGKKGSSLKKHLYRNFLLTNELVSSGADCAVFPDYFMPPEYRRPSAIVIHDLSFISHPQFYSQKFIKYYNYRIKQTLKQNPIVIAVSEHTRRNIIKFLGVREENILIVQGYSKKFNPLNTTDFKNERPYLLSVGHIEPRKNINFMIEGFLKWKRENNYNYRLKIVGALWINSPGIKQMLQKYLAHPDIEFTGYVDEKSLSHTFSNAAGFVHTSFEEGFGFPVLEAMEHGLPVLCSKGIATEEISSPASITIDPCSIASYTKGLNKLSEISVSHKRLNYDIRYSPELMRRQLDILLNRLDCRINRIFESNIPKAKSKTEALEKTFIYSSLFNTGIRKENLYKQVFDISLGKEELQKYVNLLTLQGIVKQDNDLIYLNKEKREFYKKSNKRIDKVKLVNILSFMNRLPFVSSIAFSGGTTHYGLENHDDVDLFIITKPYALYLVYIIIHIYSILTNSRRELCVNYLVDEYDLHINHSYDFYTAHQIISLTAYKNYRMLNKFWKENEWVKNIYPNFEITNDFPKKTSSFYRFLKPVNKLLMIFYRRMYKNKLQLSVITNSVLLTEHTIKLHTKDNRHKIIKEFENAWKEYSERNRIKKLLGEKENLKIAL